MDLKTYINSFPVGERHNVRKRLGTAIGVTEVAVRHYVNGIRRVPAERVLSLEAATHGLVPKHRIRPDLYPPEPAHERLAS